MHMPFNNTILNIYEERQFCSLLLPKVYENLKAIDYKNIFIVSLI